MIKKLLFINTHLQRVRNIRQWPRGKYANGSITTILSPSCLTGDFPFRRIHVYPDKARHATRAASVEQEPSHVTVGEAH